MQNQSLHSLKLDPRNPRTLSKEQYEKLERTLNEFGDLSSITQNETTGELVGGNQRTQVFLNNEADAKIVITQPFEIPTRTGTVAIGYVIVRGEMYGFRRVRWTPERQRAASISANASGGVFDRDMLTEQLHELQQLENSDELLGLTGIEDAELAELLGQNEPEQEKDSTDENRMSFKLNDHQYARVEQALAVMKASKNLQAEANPDTDGNALYYICEAYLAQQEPVS